APPDAEGAAESRPVTIGARAGAHGSLRHADVLGAAGHLRRQQGRDPMGRSGEVDWWASGLDDVPKRTVKAGEMIFREGDDPAGKAFLIHEGRVEMRRRM